MTHKELDELLLICPQSPISLKTMKLVISTWKRGNRSIESLSDDKLLSQLLNEGLIIQSQDEFVLNRQAVAS